MLHYALVVSHPTATPIICLNTISGESLMSGRVVMVRVSFFWVHNLLTPFGGDRKEQERTGKNSEDDPHTGLYSARTHLVAKWLRIGTFLFVFRAAFN